MGFLECFIAVQDATCATLAAIGYSVELLLSLVLNRRNALFGPPPKLMVPVCKLNDSLYELYSPAATPRLQVLFFHGFQLGDYEDAHLSTWKSGDGACIWPQTWLAEKFPNAQILCVSYNARVMKSTKDGSCDLYLIAENLTSDLLEANIGQERRCPTILVGHGFGGLVIKQLLLFGSEFRRDAGTSSNFNNFLASLKGIFFYSTPHHGIPFDMAAHFVTESPLLEYVKVLSKEAGRLEYSFQNLCKQYKSWKIAGLGESLPIQRGRFHGLVVVPEGASRYGTNFNIVEGADHISICQPKEKTSRSFNALTTLIGNIVSDSEIMERSGDSPCPVNKAIFGIDDVLEEVKSKLDKAKSLGLVGMGGVGKTTMAMVLFNAVIPHYDYTCFIRDVKNRKGSVENLMLAHMYYQGMKVIGKANIQFLRGERLLLILDDVISEEDLEMVSTLRDGIMVHEDSRFVATSRDNELLNLCLAEVYPVPFLSSECSKRLLCTSALPDGVPPSFERHLDRVVEKCGGLPLTLEVMGKYLYRKPELIWEQAIEALSRADALVGFDAKLWAKLRVSYDGLDRVEQDMFLDAATVFEGEDLENAQAFWSSTTKGREDMRWQHLVDLSLVWERPSDSSIIGKKIGMHEQLLSLGRKIALTPGNNGYRIWETSVRKQVLEGLSMETYNSDDMKDIFSLILDNSDVDIAQTAHKDLVALNLDYSDLDTAQDSNEVMQETRSSLEGRIGNLLCTLTKVGRLRYLSLTGINIDQTPLPTSLLYLALENLTVSDLPFNPSQHKLLAALGLISCNELQTLPATFGQLSSLRSLALFCSSLESLPASFGQLSSLRELEIECPNLISLPDSFGHLRMLKGLWIHSLDLRHLPESIGNLQALEALQIWECNGLTRLPDSLAHLQKLKRLEICCGAITHLPESICNLKALETLDLESCDALTCLPDSLGHLPMVKSLSIRNLPIEKLPETFGNLKALEDLKLWDCDALTSLPDSFGSLSRLKKLRIHESGLEVLPDSFGCLPMLESLYLYRVPLEKLPETFGNLKGLQCLSVDECNLLKDLPDSIGCLLRLKTLEISVCRLLQELPDTFLQLQGLENIQLLWTSLKSIPNLENLRSLKSLELFWCEDAKFPTLPECLGEVITETNYNKSPFKFNVVGGQFTILRVDHSLRTPSSGKDNRARNRVEEVLDDLREGIMTDKLFNTVDYWREISSKRNPEDSETKTAKNPIQNN